MSILLNFHAGKKNSDKLVILIETERYTRPTHSRRCLDDRKYPRGYTKRAVLHVFAPWPEENFPACVELLPSRERSLTKFVPLGWKQRNWKAKVGEGNDRSLARFFPAFSSPFVSFRFHPPPTIMLSEIEKWLDLRLSTSGKNGRFDRPVLIRLRTRSILSVITRPGLYIRAHRLRYDLPVLDRSCLILRVKGVSDCVLQSRRKIH